MIVSIRKAELPVSYNTLYSMSKNPSSPFYPAFLRIGHKVCLDLTVFKQIALRENGRRTAPE